MAGKLPSPSSVHVTGVCVFSANSYNTSTAPDISTPCPARITGRLASAIIFAASARSAAGACVGGR